MPEPNLIAESLILMAIGMGTVFSFLLLLVVLLRGTHWLAERLVPAASEPSLAPASRPTADGELIAVISAAVARYRSRRRQP